MSAVSYPEVPPPARPRGSTAWRERPAIPEWSRSLLAVLVGLMVLLLPTVVPEGETTGTPLRTLTLDIVAALAAGWTIATQPWDRERLRAALGHPVLLAALAFLAWVAASLIWSEFPQYSRYELLRHGVGVLLFFGIAHGLGERQVGAVAVTLVVAAALGGGVGLVTSTRQRDGWVAGAFQDPQLLAAVLCVALPIAAAVGFGSRDHRLRTAVGAAALVAGLALLGTQNRSAWIGLAAGLAALFGLWWRAGGARGHDGARWRSLIVPGVAVLAAVGLFLVMSQTAGNSIQRAASVTSLKKDDGWVDRLRTWQAAHWIASERPLTGYGIGAFPIQQSLYNPYSREQAAILATRPSLTENAHNTYLQLAADLGYPGLALYLALLVAGLRTSIAASSRCHGFRRWLQCGLAAALVAQMVCGVANPAWEFTECSVFLWLTLGLAVAAASEEPMRPVGQLAVSPI